VTPRNDEAPTAIGALATTESSLQDSSGTVAAAPDKQQAASSAFLTVEEVAQRHRCSTRTVRELARLNRIPCRKFSGARRLLFLDPDLELWENGCELEVIELPRGGRVVRPIAGVK
jgi:excisionase family DNA binding protein